MKLLSDLDPEEQHDIVVADSKGELPDELSDFLRSPENLRAWRNALVDAINHANSSLSTRKASVGQELSQAGYEEWRRRHYFYKGELEARLREAKDLIHQNAQTDYIALLKSERNRFMGAIRRHRDGFRTEFPDDEPSDLDAELWAELDHD